MGLCPILLNMIQFWMIDSIVKASDSLGFTNADDSPADESREPLFMNEPDSDGEGAPGRQRRHQTSVDLEGGYTSPTNRATTHSRALSPSSLDGKIDKESTASKKLDKSGKSRPSIEFQQQPSVRRRSPPPSPHYGATAGSLTGWGGFEDDPGWDGEQDAAAEQGGVGKPRSPKLGVVGRRSLSIGRGRRSSGGSGSWKLDTISPSHDQATT